VYCTDLAYSVNRCSNPVTCVLKNTGRPTRFIPTWYAPRSNRLPERFTRQPDFSADRLIDSRTTTRFNHFSPTACVNCFRLHLAASPALSLGVWLHRMLCSRSIQQLTSGLAKNSQGPTISPGLPRQRPKLRTVNKHSFIMEMQFEGP
jgi:hypothetical protein